MDMNFGHVDYETIQKVLSALSVGIRKAEMETPDGMRSVQGYYITDKQVRIDIKEK